MNTAKWENLEPGVVAGADSRTTLPINKIRRDGQTQGRLGLNSQLVDEYAVLLQAKHEFPPVRVWFDGVDFWLSDGFHRVAAAEQIGQLEIASEVFKGTLTDAQWDSYSANAEHGLRRSRKDVEVLVTRALQHPNGLGLSNNQVAKHLRLPEATVRRWRKRISSLSGEDIRLAVRGGTVYSIRTTKIGHNRISQGWRRSPKALRTSLNDMRGRASPEALRMLNIIGNWAFQGANASDCLAAIERLVAKCSPANPDVPSSFRSNV
jgi:hypothetical protein